MPFYGFPSPDLPHVFKRNAASHVVPAIPLKPSPWVIRVNPSFFSPVRKRLTGIHSKIVEFGIMPLWAEFCLSKPVFREFSSAVGHVFSSKYAHFKHLLRGQFRLKFRIKMFPSRLNQKIDIPFLHFVMNDNFFHRNCWNDESIKQNVTRNIPLKVKCMMLLRQTSGIYPVTPKLLHNA